MKKLIIFLLAAVMVFSFAACSMAATIYLDTQVGGKLDNEATESDYNPLYIGADIPLGNWKIAVEYNKGTWKYPWYDVNVDGYLVKGGYAIVNNNSVQVYLNLGLYNQDIKGTGQGAYNEGKYENDFLVGADAAFKLSDKLKLDLAIDTLLSGKYKVITYDKNLDINSLQAYKVKLTYLFNKNLGASIGYRSVIEQPKDDSSTHYYKLNANGFTAGLCYNF